MPVNDIPRWWTPRRMFLAGLWLAVIGFATFGLMIGSAIESGGLLGEVPTKTEDREAAPYWLLTGGVASLGPFGIWIFRQRRAWLALALALLSVGGAAAASLYW